MWEGALELGGVFPSGDSDISFADPSTGKKQELPLGKGTGDLVVSLFFKQHPLKVLGFEESGNYTYRRGRRVEYLQTTSVAQTAPDGSIVVLPVGNLNIDWGDELNARGRVTWKLLSQLTLAAEVSYLYRYSTTVEDFALSTASGSLTSDPLNLTSGHSYYMSARPSLLWEIGKDLKLQASVEIPILGNNYPTLPLVESLVGNSYQLEVRYGF
jgi:hypothetical protein